MANWCSTDLQFYGEKTAIADLKEKVRQANALKDDPWIKNNVGYSHKWWLGNLVLVFGGMLQGNKVLENGKVVIKETRDVADIPKVFCRGSFYVNDLDEGDDFINMHLEESWCPMIGVYELIRSYYADKGLDLFYDYFAVEPGNMIYVNTNRNIFPEIALIADGCKCYYLCSKQEVKKFLKEKGINADDCRTERAIKKAVQGYKKAHPDEQLEIIFYSDANGRAWIED